MKALVLAAGKGTRLCSETTHIPKVMREANGKPLLDYVLKSVSFIPKDDITVIVGYEKEKVISAFPGYDFAVQDKQNGTGHAVMCAKDKYIGYDGDLLITYGDMPLVSKETLTRLVEKHREANNDCTLLTFSPKGEIPPYGHIIRDENGHFTGIIEHKDATAEQKNIRELNVGIYVFSAEKLFKSLAKVKASSATGELYLTDVPKIMLEDGYKIDGYSDGQDYEFMGVNTTEDLAEVERILGAKTL